MATTISGTTSTTTGTTTGTTATSSSSSSDSSTSGTTSSTSSTSSTGAAILSSAGIGSGLDVDSIVTALVNAKKSGESTQISTKTTQIQAQQAAYTALTSSLNSLQTALTTLTTTSTFSSYAATLTDSKVGSATTMSNAQAGSYSVNVSSLATAQKRSSDSYTSGTAIGAGTLNITVGSNTMQLAVSATDSLSTIASAINQSSSNPGVTATVVNTGSGTQQLLLSSSKTGVANAYSISTSGDSSDGLSALASKLNTATTGSGATEAADASLTIDGIAVTSASNAVSGVLDGVTVNLTGTGSTTLTVTRDNTAATTAINNFVTAYNSYASTVSSLSSYDADSQTAGILLGDSTLSSLQQQVSKVMSGAVSGNAFKSMAVLGITRDSTGQLQVDSDKLSSALSSNPSAVQDLFAGSNGYATKLTSTIGDFTNVGGIIPTKQTSLTNQLTSLSDETTKLNARMTVYETQLRAQYTQLDTLMSSLNNTSSYLTTALKSLESTYTNSDS